MVRVPILSVLRLPIYKVQARVPFGTRAAPKIERSVNGPLIAFLYITSIACIFQSIMHASITHARKCRRHKQYFFQYIIYFYI